MALLASNSVGVIWTLCWWLVNYLPGGAVAYLLRLLPFRLAAKARRPPRARRRARAHSRAKPLVLPPAPAAGVRVCFLRAAWRDSERTPAGRRAEQARRSRRA